MYDRLCNYGRKSITSGGNDPKMLPLAPQFVITDPSTVTGDI